VGLYDTVLVACPVCGNLVRFQSKGADMPNLSEYVLPFVPDDVLSNVNRHSPHQCGTCRAWLAVDQATRMAIETTARETDMPEINQWYRNP
jgi:hypothetical protein